MAGFARMRTLDAWYSRVSEQELTSAIEQAAQSMTLAGRTKAAATVAQNAARAARKAHTNDSLQALAKLTERVDGRYRIVSRPPVVVPLREFAPSVGMSAEEIDHKLREQFGAYRESLQDDRKQLLERFEIVDAARKVVGVGSVGTRAFIVLLQGRNGDDPLFLQAKEATRSVLEDHLPESRYDNPGERVVQGQRMMQAASDIFLGWTEDADAGRYLYWRQLRDMKGSAVVEAMVPDGLALYGRVCGRTMARAHARSGDPIAIASYLGKKDRFDRAILDFAERYADQNARDYQAFVEAVESGRLPVQHGV
jgi:uncharacterized protein (DUF2252 family)